MQTGRAVLVIIGALTALLGAALIAAGGGVLLADRVGRDDDGFFTSPGYAVSSAGHAVVSDEVDLGAQPADWAPAPGDVVVRLTARADTERAVFVGIGPEPAVTAYLEGVAHDRVTRLGESPVDVVTTAVSGTRQPAPPGQQGFWAASAQGAGSQTATWDLEPGTWRLVVMNADGSPDVRATASAGVDVAFLPWVGAAILVAGLVIAAVAATLLVLGAVTGQAGPPPVIALTGDGRTYPLAVRGALDPDLSRWQWSVKWVLAIPHMIVLGVLWLGFVVLTFVAWVAILATGRYPRALFDFNVGVLRWSWRVAFYAFGVIGTDRYPPFSLQPDPTYPADLDVVPPGTLSRWRALIKPLLALPHLIIVGLLTGSTFAWSVDVNGDGGLSIGDGGGVISILALLVGVILLFSGRYPQGLFDVVMGLQRWVFRVGAYVTLMTDDYPPFRLDTGGPEPGTAGLIPPPPPPPPAPPPPPPGQRTPGSSLQGTRLQ